MSRGSQHDGLDSRGRLARELRRFTGLGAALFRAAAARTGMTVTDLQVMDILESVGPATAGQLADHAGLTTGAITGMLNRLEAAGLIQRERDPEDGRRVIVQLAASPEAQQKIGDILAAIESAWDEVISGYNDEQVAFLSDFLMRGNEHARNEIVRLREAPEHAGGPVSAPLAGLESARLAVLSRASRVSVRAGEGMSELYQARFEGPAPEVKVEGDIVTIRYPRRISLLGGKQRVAEVTLNAAIAWQISIQGEAADVSAELGGLSLVGLDVKGGYSSIRLNLPVPSGEVPIRIGGAAVTAMIRRPAGVPARVRLKGWASVFTFDEQRFSNFGNNARLQSPDYDSADQRYDIALESSVSTVTITSV